MVLQRRTFFPQFLVKLLRGLACDIIHIIPSHFLFDNDTINNSKVNDKVFLNFSDFFSCFQIKKKALNILKWKFLFPELENNFYYVSSFCFYFFMAPSKALATEVKELLVLKELEKALLHFFQVGLLFLHFWLFVVIAVLVLL